MSLSKHNVYYADGSVNQAVARKLFGILRRENGLSQKLVAQRIGISDGYMCQLENGKYRWTPQMVEDAWLAMEELIDRGVRNRLTKLEVKAILNLYNEGVGPNAISNKTGISLKSVKGVLYFGWYSRLREEVTV
jgi:transcriptional regulator with XRE-family HTH domain